MKVAADIIIINFMRGKRVEGMYISVFARIKAKFPYIAAAPHTPNLILHSLRLML